MPQKYTAVQLRRMETEISKLIVAVIERGNDFCLILDNHKLAVCLANTFRQQGYVCCTRSNINEGVFILTVKQPTL